MAEEQTKPNLEVKNVEKKWATYGNNYFVLMTKVGENFIQMDGVMTELPALSLTADWEASPAATIGDELGKLANSEFVEFLSQKGGTEGVHMVNSDQMTSRTYKSGSKLSFNLKFRCYPGQKVGPHELRTAREWMSFLSLTTPVNSNCGINVGNLLQSGGAAVDGVVELFKALKDGDETTKKNKDKDDLYIEVKTDEESNKGFLKGVADNISDDKAKKKAQEGVKAIETAMDGTKAHASLLSESKLGNPRLYGANIFMLRIYPFIFEQRFTVIVKSWSVTPSREWNKDMNDHYFYDFDISVEMDQVPCSATWSKLFGKMLRA